MLDLDGDGRLDAADVRAGLDVLYSRQRASHAALASVLLRSVCGAEQSVCADEWLSAITREGDALVARLLPHVEPAVEAICQERQRRRLRQRAIGGASQDVGRLAQQSEGVFPRQRIQGSSLQRLQSLGLQRLEPCPEGYSIVNANLGRGSFANVFLVENAVTGNVQAMKRINREKMGKTCGLSEVQVARMIEAELRHLEHSNHPHIVKLVEFCQDSRFSYFVMDAANGGNLKMLIDKTYSLKHSSLTETYIADVLHQSLYALEHLHRDFRIHKDVKPENLMLLRPEGRPHVVLIDLGMTEMIFEEEERGKGPVPAGTAQTIAPEVVDTHLGRRPQGFDERCDVYSMGVVAFELLMGRLPYEPALEGARVDYVATRARMDVADAAGQLLKAGRSAGAADMVRRMLALDPEDRPSALECMRHPWMLEHAENRRRRTARADGRRAMAATPGVGSSQGPVEEAKAGCEVLRVRRKAIAEALLEFSKKSPRQRMAVYHLCKCHVPCSELPRVSEVFRRINRGLDGELSFEELAAELVEVLQLDEAHARDIAQALDVEGDGFVSFAEFAAACVSLQPRRAHELLKWVFEALDKAGADGMSLDEVHDVLERAAGGRLQMADVTDWLKEALGGLESMEGKIYHEALVRHFGQAAASASSSAELGAERSS